MSLTIIPHFLSADGKNNYHLASTEATAMDIFRARVHHAAKLALNILGGCMLLSPLFLAGSTAISTVAGVRYELARVARPAQRNPYDMFNAATWPLFWLHVLFGDHGARGPDTATAIGIGLCGTGGVIALGAVGYKLLFSDHSKQIYSDIKDSAEGLWDPQAVAARTYRSELKNRLAKIGIKTARVGSLLLLGAAIGGTIISKYGR